MKRVSVSLSLWAFLGCAPYVAGLEAVPGCGRETCLPLALTDGEARDASLSTRHPDGLNRSLASADKSAALNPWDKDHDDPFFQEYYCE
ncbi:MAG: hypothetical protein AAF654_10115 [Myxococcota bacterium]